MVENNTIIWIIVIVLIILLIWCNRYPKEGLDSVEQNDSQFNWKLYAEWRKAIYDMREYIIRTVYQLPGQQELANQFKSDMQSVSNILSQMYDTDFDELFKYHSNIFLNLVTSLITYDGENYDNNSYAWAKNAHLIAGQLVRSNPTYDYPTLKKLFLNYLMSVDAMIRANLKQQAGLTELDNVFNAEGDLVTYIIKGYGKN
jgi:hypothetical protein